MNRKTELESEVELYLVDRVKGIGGMAVKFIPDNIRGMPDRLLLLPHGKVIWVELKRPTGGKVASAQLVMHEKLRRLGQRVELIRSREEVDKLVELVK